MKKILASIATVVALTGLAAGAHAAGDNTAAGGSSTAADFNSEHTGSVTPTCSLKVDNGALPATAGLVSSLTSTTKGKIATVCNSATSNLAVSIDSTTPAAGNVLAATLTGYLESFELTGGTGPYAAIPAGFITTSTTSDLTNGYSATAATVDVAAKVAVGSTFNLPAGAYIVKVKATVTP